MAGAFLVFAPAPSPAEAEEMIEGDVVGESSGSGKGMPASNPRVKGMLTAHPGEFVTICVAGCAGKPSIVQMLPMPLESRAGEMRTTAGSLDGPRRRGPAQPAGYSAASSDATTCVAGCGGPPGQVLQRMPGLPQPAKSVPRGEAEAGNEPLDIGR